MNYHINSSQSSLHNSITTEQLNQVIEAITDGRYSWACVLILRFVGYNPLHFIPQRTYSRLLKENRQVPSGAMSLNSNTSANNNTSVTNSSGNNKVFSQAVIEKKLDTKQGINMSVCLESKIAELYRRHK
ncbi:HetP family heterocyst commitment protein [Anabaena subtropica]|uniref:HetP family heterocyst commitment protein n=1 Tax=Anabaena subtropica FACHB-260 TaxID=2692884 RepID=A0ABR8CSG4_9NOST|nr:HetP family heterocyst commitment protein [Anabaena subtropica]MBD2345299.1 HetP family heterocyst commitment protein [Anabaena subtropica FACHB-260]